jgi:hypothetical protein
METRAARDEMKKRVRDTFGEWKKGEPDGRRYHEFLLLPPMKSIDPKQHKLIRVPVRAEIIGFTQPVDGTDPKPVLGPFGASQGDYVQALFTACAEGIPVGRLENNIVVERDPL